MPNQPDSLQQEIHDFLRQRLVQDQAIDWIDVNKLAEDLVYELGLDQIEADAEFGKSVAGMFRKLKP